MQKACLQCHTPFEITDADFLAYEEKSETAAKNLTVLLEPLILIVIWLGVLFLALAIIMPIYGLLSGIR